MAVSGPLGILKRGELLKHVKARVVSTLVEKVAKLTVILV